MRNNIGMRDIVIIFGKVTPNIFTAIFTFARFLFFILNILQNSSGEIINTCDSLGNLRIEIEVATIARDQDMPF